MQEKKQTTILDLKKGDVFEFNSKEYTVKQKYREWKKDDPYLKTVCGQLFHFDELEIIKK